MSLLLSFVLYPKCYLHILQPDSYCFPFSLDHLINPVNVAPDILHILDSLDAIIRQHELRRRASSERQNALYLLHDQDVVNIATAKGENTEEEKQDNSVRIVDETPGLQIKKSSDKESYKVGETGHYTVTVTNTEKGTTARNVIIKDALQVEGAKIVEGSIKIYNDAGKLMDDAEIEHSATDYAIATGHDLEYKEQFTVNYDVLFEAESLAGKDILNVARALVFVVVVAYAPL